MGYTKPYTYPLYPMCFKFPIYVPMGIFLTHTLAIIGFLPAGYTGNGYPLPSLILESTSNTEIKV